MIDAEYHLTPVPGKPNTCREFIVTFCRKINIVVYAASGFLIYIIYVLNKSLSSNIFQVQRLIISTGNQGFLKVISCLIEFRVDVSHIYKNTVILLKRHLDYHMGATNLTSKFI